MLAQAIQDRFDRLDYPYDAIFLHGAYGDNQPLNRKLASQLLAPGWTCDVGKARRLLGFEATTGLAESVDRSARWYLEHGWL